MIVSLEPHSITDVFATIRLVARLAGVEERGDELVEELGRRVEALRTPAPRRLVAVIEWLAPIFAPGHWVPDQIRLAGGTSVFGLAGERSRQSTWHALADAQPECIVLGLCGFDLGRTLEEWNSFEPPDAVTETPAWRSGQVWAIDGSAYVSRPGPRLVEGIQALNAILTGRPDARASHLTL
jgi:iron complex transport system substrate-binding protein